MWNLKACIVCFSTVGKLYKINRGPLKQWYCLVSGATVDDMVGMPQYLCVECSAHVRKFKNFRDKCKRANYAMKELLKSNKQISDVTLEAINRNCLNIAPSISYMDLSKVHYETVKFKWNTDKINRGSISSIPGNDLIPVLYCSTVNVEEEFQILKKKPRTSGTVKQEAEELNQNNIEIKENSHFGENFIDQSTLANNDDFFDNDNLGEDDDAQEIEGYICKKENAVDQNVDGSNSLMEEEYASVIPISMKEAKAVVEVYKGFCKGNYRCTLCGKAFHNEKRLVVHSRMHDQHISGNFQCVLCQQYYKTEFLLKTHITDKHSYKYLCRKCPEVSFDRMSAKQHYIWTHLQKGITKTTNWYDERPSWLRKSGGKRVKGVCKMRPIRKTNKLPEDFLVYTPVTQEEQYALVEERKKSRNYLEATYKCEFCYRGFREALTYGKHMKKHDPAVSGNLQCDMCKLYFRDARKLYKHMIITHLFKYSCQVCNYSCYNKGQAHMHYRWHKNVTYNCPHCNKEFKKASTRLTHIRIKHPSTNICNLCGHSFVSENGLYCHKKLAHTKEEIETSEAVQVDLSSSEYCAECEVQFTSAAAFKTHLGSSNKHASTNVSIKPVRLTRGGRRVAGPARARNGSSEIVNTGVATATHCELCNKYLANDVQARKHYEAEHPGADFLKRYMCDVCGHTTRQYANLMVHMRTHTQEKPYGCPHCDRRFSMPSNRDRHLVVHTGEKKYQCQHCSRRFTQSSAVKLHIQTVHLKIPYAPWDKKNRKRRKEAEGAPLIAAIADTCAPPKLLLETHADYLNAYITYNDE